MGPYSPCLLTGSSLALTVPSMEAWWAHTVVLAAPVIYALASVPAGGLRGTDVLIYRGDGRFWDSPLHLAPRPGQAPPKALWVQLILQTHPGRYVWWGKQQH